MSAKAIHPSPLIFSRWPSRFVPAGMNLSIRATSSVRFRFFPSHPTKPPRCCRETFDDGSRGGDFTLWRTYRTSPRSPDAAHNLNFDRVRPHAIVRHGDDHRTGVLRRTERG